MTYKKGDFLSEGKGKSLYTVQDQPDLVWMDFKDDLTAFNGQKKSSFKGKGQINRDMSSLVFHYLKKQGVKNHWVRSIGETGLIGLFLKMCPLEVVVRNRLAGSIAQKFKIEEGRPLSQPLVEFYYKNDSLGDPFISSEQAVALGFVSQKRDMDFLTQRALLVNQKMKALFDKVGLDLIDFKLEFGQTMNSTLNKEKELFILGDEFSCDICRLWDKKTGERQDKDRFRRDLGHVAEAYKKVYLALQKGV